MYVIWMRENGWLSFGYDMEEIEDAAYKLILYAEVTAILLGGTIHPELITY